MAKATWSIIHDMDNEDGTATCFCQEAVTANGTHIFIYCTEGNCLWECEWCYKGSGCFSIEHMSKSLAGCKAWWKNNLQRILADIDEA